MLKTTDIPPRSFRHRTRARRRIGAAAIGAATGATPPFQDCLKVAATNAGFGSQTDGRRRPRRRPR